MACRGKGDIGFKFRLNKTFQIPSDTHNLGIMLGKTEILSRFSPEILLEGWYEREEDLFFPYRGMSQKATLFLPHKQLRKHKYISFYICFDFTDLSQKLTLSLGKEILCEILLLTSWNY